MTRFAPLAAAAAAALLLAVPAHAKAARCAISGGAETPYKGPCRFLAERGGSFTVTPSARRTFMGDVTSVSVYVTGPGLAEVRGLTTGGVNSRWGEARRSRRDPACWDGSDFRVCVY
ncbi:MAG: hypothetical protein JOZ90_14150 [Alphaproteobacteria bacterium]|nr:hypothetical protein [Alphaproteobacteria bacterium]MBV9371605.1 hypothetical protein [Alphaproteobacteria bacterium]MBV9902214.1 hypothetical protein [Alphaproteobacteria bacterium]